MMIRTTSSSISVKPLSSRTFKRCLRECMQFSFAMGTMAVRSAAASSAYPPERGIRGTPVTQRGGVAKMETATQYDARLLVIGWSPETVLPRWRDLRQPRRGLCGPPPLSGQTHPGLLLR